MSWASVIFRCPEQIRKSFFRGLSTWSWKLWLCYAMLRGVGGNGRNNPLPGGLKRNSCEKTSGVEHSQGSLYYRALFRGNPSKLDIIDVHCLIPRKNIFNRMIPDSWQFLVKYHPFQHSSAQRVWQCFFANRPLTANILMSPKWVNKTNGPLQCSVPKPSWKKRQSCFSSSGESVKLEIAGFTCFKFLHFKQTTLCKLPMQCSYCTLYNDIWYIHTITYVACLPTKILNRKSCYSLMCIGSFCCD